MKGRFATGLLACLTAGLLACSAASGAMIGIYRNGMETLSQRSQLIKLTGRSCSRAGAGGELRVTIGKRTSSCSFRTPVIGRDLEIAATERLSSSTPKALQHAAYLGVELRAGGGSKYRFLAFPLQEKVQLVKITPEGTKFLAIEKNVSAVGGLDMPNTLRLRAVNVTSGEEKGQAQLIGFLGSEPVVEATDAAAGELTGRFSAVTVGDRKAADGLVAGIDNVVVRVPSPF
jgi:hypothetical protein